jgi:hypothetical protein
MNRGASSRGAVCDNRSSRISNIFYVFLSVKSINRIYREQTYKGIRGGRKREMEHQNKRKPIELHPGS